MYVLFVSTAVLILGYCIGRVSGGAEPRIEYYPEDLHAVLAGYGRLFRASASTRPFGNVRRTTDALVTLARQCADQDDTRQLLSHAPSVTSLRNSESGGPPPARLLHRWGARGAPSRPRLTHQFSLRSGTMDEIVNLVSQKTGLPADKAQMAVQTVVGFLKDKLPGPVAEQIDSLLAGGSVAGGAGGIADAVKGMTGLFSKE